MKFQLALTTILASVLAALACCPTCPVIRCFQRKGCKGPAVNGITIQQCLTGRVIFGCYAIWGPDGGQPNEEKLCSCATAKMEECFGYNDKTSPEYLQCREFALKDIPCEEFDPEHDCADPDIYSECLVENSSNRRKLGTNGLPMCLPHDDTGKSGPGPAGGDGGSCTCSDDSNNVLCATPSVSFNNQGMFMSNKVPLKVVPVDGDPAFTKTLTFDCNVWVGGDPHIKTWDGSWYDWHGECDTVLLSVPDYGYGMGLTVHARTKRRYDYSFIETAAVQIGDDILEISGMGDYFLNGVDQAELPAAISSNHFLTHEQISENDHKYLIDLSKGIRLVVKTHKDTVSVSIDAVLGADAKAFSTWFRNSTGLMGAYPSGALVGRDGRLVTANEMGDEWQVRDFEPKLFQVQDRHPQYPQKCMLPEPDALQTHRRLTGDAITEEAAEAACSNWETEDAKARCIYDVIATGDLTMAVAGSY